MNMTPLRPEDYVTTECSGGTGMGALRMTAEEAIARLRGIRCGFKPTSCPDQLSIALEKALEAETAKAD